MRHMKQWVRSIVHSIIRLIKSIFKRKKMALTKQQLLALISSKIYTNVANEVSGDDVADVVNEIVETMFRSNVEVPGAFRLTNLAGFNELERELAIDSEGFAKTINRTLLQITSGTSANFDMDNHVHIINVAANFTLNLPDAFDYNGREIVIRKSSSSSYSLSVSCVDTDIRMDSFQGASISATAQGAWVRLKSYVQVGEWAAWFVIEDSGDFSGVI